MTRRIWLLSLLGVGLPMDIGYAATTEAAAVALPAGVQAVWDTRRAHRDTTPTRERICLNGLWRWQPAAPDAPQPPQAHWGYFKVPGSWPGITDYEQKDCQTVHAHPAWQQIRLGTLRAAWYEREFSVPESWAGRQIALACAVLNSHAVVYVDGVRVGEAQFPGGAVDVSGACRPGAIHRLTLLVTALPLKGVLLSYTDSASARQVEGAVARRGLCGDVFLEGAPAKARVVGLRIEPSVRRRELTLEVTLAGLESNARYALRACAQGPGGERRDFRSPVFGAADLGADGRRTMKASWMPEALWDLHTPGNLCSLELVLEESNGTVLDAYWPERFGFRELWIDGRDFVLNGSRLWLSTVPLDNAQVGAAWATYDAARESLERLRGFGINFVYTHNYGCEPGSHLDFEAILRAADDVGMLVALSQPHFSHYTWEDAAADRENGYARHAAFYARTAGNHPSVVAYAMSHNATGYDEDMNPDMIDGVQAARDGWATRNVRWAQRAEALVRALDPGRILYHHASGNLGPLHAVNFYPNFAPIQELSDWFEGWATRGVKPVFLCEYGAPFTWDWTMYRGWYRGEREFGSARVPWEFCLAEWNAQFFGDAAFPASLPEQANLRWEAEQFRAGRLWHRWDYPHQVGSTRFEERYPVFADYLTQNWRAFRTWGVSVVSPWEHGHFWRLREGVDRGRKALATDWEHLQRPGFSPDYLEERYERVDLAYDRSDWIATPAAEALHRNNGPLLAWIAGPSDRFTARDHHYRAGQVVEKTLVLVNNSRRSVDCAFDWRFDLPTPQSGQERMTLATGEQARRPLRLVLPDGLAPGRYELRATASFGGLLEPQEDHLAIDVLPPFPAPSLTRRIGLIDPEGETAAWLNRIGIRFELLPPGGPLPDLDVLILGRRALSLAGPGPDLKRVREGLRVVLFEQSARVLEQRLGFRVTEYGLRQVFARVPDHPLLNGLAPEHLAYWNGEATLQPPRLEYTLQPRRGPTVSWCGISVPRLWRCGNRGNVASVLIEKPARGDFLPVLDGGYSLQYSPLLVCQEGSGLIVLCQLDVTGRSEPDPVAERLACNLLRFAETWAPGPRRRLFYAGDPAGKAHWERLGLDPETLDADRVAPVSGLLVLGPRTAESPDLPREAIHGWVGAGGALLGVGLGSNDLRSLPLGDLRTRRALHISTGFAPAGLGSPLAGIGPADVHLRDPRELDLVAAGARVAGNGVLAWNEPGPLVFCQVAPWQFEDPGRMNLRRTHRRLAYLTTRLLSNLGVASPTPLVERFHAPAQPGAEAPRWLSGLYLDRPEEWDDPYRFFRW